MEQGFGMQTATVKRISLISTPPALKSKIISKMLTKIQKSPLLIKVYSPRSNLSLAGQLNRDFLLYFKVLQGICLLIYDI